MATKMAETAGTVGTVGTSAEAVTTAFGLGLEELRLALQEEYREVALHPEQGFHFHTGRTLAPLVGYNDEWVQGIPESALESFAGTGNPFSVGELRPGENVVDVGCGAGLDSLTRQPD